MCKPNQFYFRLSLVVNATKDNFTVLAINSYLFRLKAVQTTEELKDVHSHFLLYYGHEVPAMQEAVRAKERAAEAQARRARRREEGADEGDDAVEVEPLPPPPDTIKQAVRSGPYTMCRKAGIGW